MDSFSEGVLERARQRAKMLQTIGAKFASTHSGDISTAAAGGADKPSSPKSKSSALSRTKISTVMPGSPKGQMRHNVLNFQQEHFDMEIKLASMDKCLVQVEIHEQSDGDDDDNKSTSEQQSVAELREESKCRLQRLGKLYSADVVGMSSPIHGRTEEAPIFAEEDIRDGSAMRQRNEISHAGRSKLAALAQNINLWENESPLPLPTKTTTHSTMTPTKPKQQFFTKKVIAANHSQPAISSVIHKGNHPKGTLDLNDSVVNALECQGYSREDLDEKQKLLTYKFKDVKDKENVENVVSCKAFVGGKYMIEEEKRTPRGRPSIYHKDNGGKDPSALSVNERKAIFERNASRTPLLPKTPFTLNCPAVVVKPPPPTTFAKKPVVAAAAAAASDNNNDDCRRVEHGGIVTHRLKELLRNNRSEDNPPAPTISQQQIEDKIREERTRDMDLLRNRFHKPPSVPAADCDTDSDDGDDGGGGGGCKNVKFVDEAEAEVRDGNDDDDELVAAAATAQKRRQSSDHHDSRQSLLNSSGCSAQVQSMLTDVHVREVRARRTSQQQSRLYPVLSDLEVATETDDDCDDVTNSDYVESSLELSCSSDGGPTPPKCGKVLFKSPARRHQQPLRDKPDILRNEEQQLAELGATHAVDGDVVVPLQHTVSFYRKQQQNTIMTTAVRSGEEQSEDQGDEAAATRATATALDDILNDQLAMEAKMSALRGEVQTQERTIAQASQALNLCNARLEFNGSTEQVEAERLLLIAAHRRQAALYEMGRLQHGGGGGAGEGEEGDLVVGRLTLPLKREYVRALGAAGGSGHHVVCLVKCDDAEPRVAATRLVSTAATSEQTSVEGVVDIRQSVQLKGVRAHSTVSVEVYCLQAHDQQLPHHVKYHIKQRHAHTPRKLLVLSTLHMGRSGGHGTRDGPAVMSPGGPHAVRSTSFALMGYAVFTVRSILACNSSAQKRRQLTLNATPHMSPLEGSVEVGEVCCQWRLPAVERCGFLTMFEDVSGFGAWHRRWFRLQGDVAPHLRYWKYPDDEASREGRVVELRGCRGTPSVGPVPREVCARLHTILLELTAAGDGTQSQPQPQPQPQPRRYLLSADTKAERIAWCADLNRVIAAIHLQYT